MSDECNACEEAAQQSAPEEGSTGQGAAKQAPAEAPTPPADPPKIDIVLASASPRRQELLAREGVKFSVRPAGVSEELDDIVRTPEEVVQKLAERKAGWVVQEILAENYQGAAAIIGADTIVVLAGRIFGKPENPDDAKRILRTLSGRTHEVITGVSVWLLSAPEVDNVSLGFRTFTETTRVTFKELSDEQIDEYVAGGEPLDKAGAYAIQGEGAAFVEGIEGDFDNVVGLPVTRLLDEFSEIFAAAR